LLGTDPCAQLLRETWRVCAARNTIDGDFTCGSKEVSEASGQRPFDEMQRAEIAGGGNRW